MAHVGRKEALLLRSMHNEEDAVGHGLESESRERFLRLKQHSTRYTFNTT